MRSKKSIYNIITNLILQLATSISGFFVSMHFLNTYGSEINGLNSTINQIISFISILEGGLGTATVYALYQPLYNNDWPEINKVLSAAKVFYKKISKSIFMISILLIIIVPFFVNSNINNLSISMMILLSTLSIIIDYLFCSKYKVLLRANQKVYIISLVQIISLVISTIMKLYFISMKINFIYIIFINIIYNILILTIIRAYINKNYKNLDFNTEINDTLLKNKSHVLIHNISNLVLYNTDIILISTFLDLKISSIYSSYNFVFTSVNMLISSFSMGISPMFAQLILEDNEYHFKNVFNQYKFIFYSIIGTAYSIAYILIIPFIRLYTQNVMDINYIDNNLVLLFIFSGVIVNIKTPMICIIDARGKFKETKKAAILEAGLNLVLSLLLINVYGIYGILIATIIAVLYRTIFTIKYVNSNILNTSFLNTLKEILFKIIYYSISAIFIKKILAYLNILYCRNWIEFIKLSVVSSALIIMITVTIAMITDRKTFKSLINKFNYELKRHINLNIKFNGGNS